MVRFRPTLLIAGGKKIGQRLLDTEAAKCSEFFDQLGKPLSPLSRMELSPTQAQNRTITSSERLEQKSLHQQ
jgi:hypothetical protein